MDEQVITAQATFEELLERFPIDFVIPQRICNDLQRRGVTPTVRCDNRLSTRFRTNGSAILSWVSSDEECHAPHPPRQVIVQDLSNTGIGFLTSAEWYPGQIGRLQLPIGEATIKIMRSRRIGSRCYEIGARLIEYAKHDADRDSGNETPNANADGDER